jgi:ABC-2 type transport system ATP-binding protein
MTADRYTIIKIHKLTKEYETGFWRKKKVRALDSLTLSVKSGQIFGFLGGNGAGKTTTIKILMGLLFPTSGSASILGEDISNVGTHQKIGYCPENPYFYDYLTARELMDYFGDLFGLDRQKRRQRTEKLLDLVGLDEKARGRQLRKFSKGMLQRVGLAQALINDPEVVFLDEPMSGLDPIGRREIRELIASLREDGKTVFMSTHILSDIEALCDEVAILRKGKLAATGNLQELLEQSGELRTFEIIFKGISVSSLNGNLSKFKENMTDRPNGISIEVDDETHIEEVIREVRYAGGHIVSLQPVKQSLEELFVKETNGSN